MIDLGGGEGQSTSWVSGLGGSYGKTQEKIGLKEFGLDHSRATTVTHLP